MSYEMIPVWCIQLSPEQLGIVPSAEHVEKVRKALHDPVSVYRDPKLGLSKYGVSMNVATVVAAQMLGLPEIKCQVVHGLSFFQELRAIGSPVAWAQMAQALMDSGYTLEAILNVSQLPRSVVLGRLATWNGIFKRSNAHGLATLKTIRDPIDFGRGAQNLLDEHPELTVSEIANATGVDVNLVDERILAWHNIKRAEEHGKSLGHAEARQERGERRAQAIIATNRSTGKISQWKAHPSERGKVRCLEPKCAKWIIKPQPRGYNSFGETYKPGTHFCKAHRKSTIDAYPLVDREGDPIWISAGFVVCKMSQMGESHLTATLAYIANAANGRAKLSGVEWEKLVGQRYPLLVAEAKRRDEKLKCDCNDGLKSVESPMGTMVNFCTCAKGKQQALATEIARDLQEGSKKEGTTLEKRHVITVVVAFILGQLVAMPWLTGDLVRYVLQAMKIQ